MTADFSNFEEKVTQWLEHWNETIGPRPAGSPAEQKLQREISAHLQELGYRMVEYPFAFAPDPVFLPYSSLAGIFLILIPWLLPQIPWAAVFLPFIPSALPGLSMAIHSRLPRRSQAKNLLALPAGVDLPQVRLILCAHTDTARAVPEGSDSWFRFRLQSAGLARRMGWILLVLVLIHLLLFPLARPVFSAAATLSSLIGLVLIGQDVWEQLGSRDHFAPGINDNASGVAVLLGLAEKLKENGSIYPTSLLFTSAEECGLFGAQAFARELKKQGIAPNIVSVDMVGAGDRLRLIHEAGELFTLRADRDLLSELDQAIPDAQHKRLKTRSGDFAAFIREGFKACGMESNGTRRSWRAYHTLKDDMRIIDPTMLALTLCSLENWLIPKPPASEADEPGIFRD